MKRSLLALMLLCSFALTGKAAINYLLNESFESGIPDDWSQQVLGSASAYWVVDTENTFPTGAYEGNQRVALRNTTGRTAGYITRLITPAMDISTVYSPQVSFAYAQPAYTGYHDTLVVYYRLNTSSSWTRLATFEDAQSNWTSVTLGLVATYGQATSFQLAFEARENMGRGVILDDVRIFPESQCTNPYISGTLVGSNSTTIFWQGDLGRNYELIVHTSSISDLSSFDTANAFFYQNNITTLNKMVTGLNPSTHYYAYLRSDCEDNATGHTEWTSVDFTTAVTFPYHPDMTSASLNSMEQVSGNLAKIVMADDLKTGSSAYGWSYTANTTVMGTAHFYGQVDYSSTPTWLVLPLIDLTEVTAPAVALSFRMALTSGSSSTSPSSYQNTASLWIMVSDDNGQTWLALDSIKSADISNISQRYNFLLSDYIGSSVKLAMVAKVNSTSAYFHVSDISVDEFDLTCAGLKELKVLPNAEDASVSWNVVGTNYNAIVVLSSTSAYADSLQTLTVSTNAATLQNLTPQTTYYLSVRQDCNTTDVLRTSFKTTCIPQTEFPWSEDFDAIPTGYLNLDCWSNEHAAGSGSSTFEVSSAALGNNTSGHLLRLPDMSRGTQTLLSLPIMSIDEANAYTFSFSIYRNNSYSGPEYYTEGIRVFINLDGDTAQSLAFVPRLYSVQGEGVPAEAAEGWYTYSFTIPVAGNVHILLRGESRYGSATSIDDFLVEKMPTCRNMGLVTVSAVREHGFTLDFPPTNASQYQVVVATALLADPNTFATSNAVVYQTISNSNHVVIDDASLFTSNSSYVVYVRGYCSEDDQSLWASPVLFHTACSSVAVGDFNGETFDNEGSLNCWRTGVLTEGSRHIGVYADRGYSTAYGAYLRLSRETADSTYDDGPYAITPKIDFGSEDIRSYQISFSAASTSSASNNLKRLNVAVVSDPSDLSDIYIARSIVLPYAADSAGEQFFTINFTDYMGDAYGDYGQYIMFYASESSAHDSATYILIDNVSLEEVSSCPQLVETSISDVTVSSAVMHWEESSANSFEVLVADFFSRAPDTLSSIAFRQVVDSDTALITGLMGTSTYYAYVRAICGEGDTAQWSNPAVFRTAIGLPYYEDFNYSVFPIGWTLAKGVPSGVFNGDTLHVLTSTSTFGWNYTESSNGLSANHLKINIYNSTSGEWIISPIIDMSATEDAQLMLTFDFAYTDFNSASSPDNGSNQALFLLVSTDDGQSWSKANSWEWSHSDATAGTVFNTLSTIPTTGTTLQVDLSRFAGETIRLAFAATTTSGDNDFHIANLSLTQHLANCERPTDLTLTSLGTTSLLASWSGDTAKVSVLELSNASDFNPILRRDSVPAGQLLDTLENLNTSTRYYARVRQVCNGGVTVNSASVSAATDCAAISFFPWTDNFENYKAGSSYSATYAMSADCWRNVHLSGNGTSLFYVYSSTSGQGGNTSNMLVLPDMSSGTMTLLALPAMQMEELDAYEFSMDIYRTSSTTYTTEGIRIFASNSDELDDSAVELAFISRDYSTAGTNVPAETGAGWYTYHFSIPLSGRVHILLRGESRYGSSTYMDNFAVTQVPPCQNLKTLLVTPNTTQAQCRVSYGSEQYQVLLASTALPTALLDTLSDTNVPEIIRFETVTSTSFTLTDLEPSTPYYLYARGVCDDSIYTNWIAVQFTTLCLVDIPYMEDFDNASERKTLIGNNTLPSCWEENYLSAEYIGRVFDASTMSSSSTYSYAYSGTSALGINSNATNPVYVCLPQIAASMDTLRLTFKARALYGYTTAAGKTTITNRATASYAHAIKVGTMTDPNDASTFRLLDNLILKQIPSAPTSFDDDPSGNQYWETFTVYLAQAEGEYLTFCSDYAIANFVWIDDVEVSAMPACPQPAPTRIKSQLISGNTADLVWMPIADRYEVLVGMHGFDISSEEGVSYVVDTAYVHLVNLLPGTEYDYYIRSLCSADESSDWTSVRSFTTACLAPIGSVFDFEDKANTYLIDGTTLRMENCWKVTYTGTSNSYKPQLRTNSSSITYSYSGDSVLQIATNSSNHAAVIMPMIDADLDTVKIRFMGRAGYQTRTGFSNASANYANAIKVGTLTDPDDLSTFHLVRECHGVANTALASTDPEGTNYWRQFDINLTGAVGQYIVFLSDYDATNYFYIDSVQVLRADDCLPVEAPQVNDITSNSILVTMEQGAELYRVELLLNGDVVRSVIVGDSAYVHLTDLQPQTVYSVVAHVLCSATSESPASDRTIFTTDCETLASFPWYEGFEDLPVGSSTSSAPACWALLGANVGNAAIYVSNTTAYVNTGSQSLYFKSATSGDAFAILPMVDTLSNKEIHFSYKHSTLTGSRLSLGYMTDITSADSFVQLAEFAPSTTFDSVMIELRQVPDSLIGIARLAFRFTAAASTNYIGIDDITLCYMPECDRIWNMSVLDISGEDALVTFDTTNASTYQFILSTIPLNPDTVTMVDGTRVLLKVDTITSAPYHVENLTSLTTYYAYVRGLCGGNKAGEWAPMLTFKTTCSPIMSLPWTEDFESYTATSYYYNSSTLADPCWTNVHLSGTGTNLFYIYSSTSGTGGNTSKQLVLPDMSAGTFTKLSLPLMYIPQADEYGFKLSIYRNASGTNYITEGIRIYASLTENIDDSAVEIAFISRNYTVADSTAVPAEAAAGWYTYEFPIPMSGNIHIILRGENQNGSSTYMDNFMVRKLPECRDVKGLTANVLSDTSAQVRFAFNGASEYDVLVTSSLTEVDMLTPDQIAFRDTVTTNVVNITGLGGATTYYVYVRAMCSTDTMGDWSAPISFTTQCGLITTFPWTQNFDRLTSGIPACWDNSEGSTTTDSYKWNYYASGRIGGCLRFDSYSNQTGNTNILALPQMQLFAPAQLTFYYKNPTGGACSVLISTDGGQTTSTLLTNMEGVSNWTLYDIDLSPYVGQSIIIYFSAVSNYGPVSTDAYLYLDDVAVDLYAACRTPGNLSANVLSTEADITFNATDADHYHLLIASEAINPATILDTDSRILLSVDTLTQPFFHVTGLSAQTGYYVYVRSLCADNQSSWSSALTITTACEALSLPYVMDFEGLSASSVPECWSLIDDAASSSYASHPGVSSSFPHGGSRSFAFGNTSYTDDNQYKSWLILPVIEEDIYTLQMSFWVRTATPHSNNNYQISDSLIIGVMSNPADTNTFVRVAAYLPTSSSYTLYEMDFSSYMGNGHYIAIKRLPSGDYQSYSNSYLYGEEDYYSYSYYTYDYCLAPIIDDITIETYDASCRGIATLSTSAVSTSGLTIKYTFKDHQLHDALVVMSSSPSFTLSDALFVDTARMTDTYVINTKLQLSSSYYVHVAQICDDELSPTMSVAISTPIGIPYTPVFTSTTFPSDWSHYSGLVDPVLAGTVQLTSSSYAQWSLTGSSQGINGNHFRADVYGSSFNYWVVSPAIDLTPNMGEGLLLTFDAALTAYSSSYTSSRNLGIDDRFVVLVTTDDGQTWVKVAEWNNSGTGNYVYNEIGETATLYHLDLSRFGGQTIRIAFYAESTQSNADNYLHFGNINLDRCASVRYTAEICTGNDFDGSAHGIPFSVTAAQCQIGQNIFSEYRPSTGEGDEDSLFVFTLWVYDYFTTIIPVSLCEGEHYPLDENGFEFDAVPGVGDFVLRLTSSLGCDSVVILRPTVHSAVTSHIYDSVAQGTAYTWHGMNYYLTGTYQFDTVSVLTGCDSTTVLHLKVFIPDALRETSVHELQLAPNPVDIGYPVWIINDFTDEDVADMLIEVFSASGMLLYSQYGASMPLYITAPSVSGMHYVRISIGKDVYISPLLVK